MIGFKKIRKNIILQLPKRWQEKIIRQQIVVPKQLTGSLQVKVANTYHEMEQAFNLLYRAYLEVGFEKENKRELRVLSQHLLPTTVTLVATDQQQVVGTISIVKNGILGMPMEKEFNLENFKAEHSNVAEISSFAIEKSYRRKANGQAFYALIKYLLEYCLYYADVHHLVIVIHPHDESFYTGPFCFTDLHLPVVDYLGTPAKALTLNLQTVKNQLYEKETNADSLPSDLYQFFFVWQFPQLIFPDRQYFHTNDPIIDTNIFAKFFLERARIMDYLKTSEYFKIKLMYEETAVAQLFTKYEQDLFRNRRRHFRFHVKFAGELLSLSTNHFRTIEVTEVFTRGVIIRPPLDFQFNIKEVYVLKIEIAPSEFVNLHGHLKWNGLGHLGFIISKSNNSFQKMIDYLTVIHNFNIAS